MGENIEGVEREITGSEVLTALGSITQKEWDSANWPIVTAIPKEVYHQYDDSNEDLDSKQRFFTEVLNQDNFIYPEGKREYNPKRDILIILHSFNNREGNETIFKAITTSPRSIVEDPAHLINYKYHGQPCEIRSKQLYPTVDFWNLSDRLPSNLQDIYRIPSKEWRKNFVLKKFFKR